MARHRDEPTYGNDREGHERRHYGQVRRQLEDERVGALGRQVFFEEELYPVGERLQYAEGTRAIRPDAVLHVGDQLALEPDHEHDRDQKGSERHEDLDRDHGELGPVHARRVERVSRVDEEHRHAGHAGSIRRSTTTLDDLMS